MNINGLNRLTARQIERVRNKLTKQQQRDMLQPYINGRINREFYKAYGYVDAPQITQGSEQDTYAYELWERQHYEANTN